MFLFFSLISLYSKVILAVCWQKMSLEYIWIPFSCLFFEYTGNQHKVNRRYESRVYQFVILCISAPHFE